MLGFSSSTGMTLQLRVLPLMQRSFAARLRSGKVMGSSKHSTLKYALFLSIWLALNVPSFSSNDP